MSNSKRTYRYPGRPTLLDDVERVYRFVWLQPHSESQVPFRAKVYDSKDLGAWMGYRADDHTQLEITWLKSLWKEVPDPFAEEPLPETVPLPTAGDGALPQTLPLPLPPGSSEPLQAVTDESEEVTLEVPTS